MKTNHIYQGNVVDVLKTFPDESVNCIVTSPPYWGLRSYLKADDPMKQYEIGTEDTPQAYVAKIVEVFAELHRVLMKTGTVWLNLGDSYVSDTKWGGKSSGKHLWIPKMNRIPREKKVTGLPNKNLVGIPWRVAFALQDAGWILRTDIIWNKPSCMPESVKDRPTRSHEYLFLFVKSQRYYYDRETIMEVAQDWGTRYRSRMRNGTDDPHLKHHGLTGTREKPRGSKGVLGSENAGRRGQNEAGNSFEPYLYRNKRTVWTVNPQATSHNHFATFPPDLIEPCILAGCPEGGIVLDPFFGSGTTGRVAEKHNRQWVGVELNPDYITLAQEEHQKRFFAPLFEYKPPIQTELFADDEVSC